MPLIKVNGYGSIGFPPDMTMEQVGAALHKKFGKLREFATKHWNGMSPLDKTATATMFVPVVGDVTGLMADADMFINDPESRTLLNASLSALGALPFVPSVAGVAKRGIDTAKDMNFLHNTSASKLKRVESMGGMPMPSVAITRQDIPFDNFGDITLVGKPASFDPKATKLNQVFDADAYTVRAPAPIQVAKKGAGKRFGSEFEKGLKEAGIYTDEVSSNIWNLEKKTGINEHEFNQVKEFFNRNDRRDIFDELFDPEEFFIANPDRDFVTGRTKLKPYNAEEVTKFMKKSAGRGGEGGISGQSTGAMRAATTSELKSLKQIRGRKQMLMSADDIGEFKQTNDMMLDDLQEAFKKHYKYDSNSMHYSGEFREFLTMSESKGINSALSEIGFENVPDELLTEFSEYKDILRSSPTEYFESKPKRVVDFNEFAGAIVPDGTPQETIDLLKSKGLQIESYTDEAQRLAARSKFKDTAFQTGGLGFIGAAALASRRDEEEL